MKRLITTVFFGLLLTGCELPPPTAPASPSTEPFQTKTNDTLGYSPGHAVGRIHQETIISRDERARFCCAPQKTDSVVRLLRCRTRVDVRFDLEDVVRRENANRKDGRQFEI
jgi:hypothetical protein